MLPSFLSSPFPQTPYPSHFPPPTHIHANLSSGNDTLINIKCVCCNQPTLVKMTIQVDHPPTKKVKREEPVASMLTILSLQDATTQYIKAYKQHLQEQIELKDESCQAITYQQNPPFSLQTFKRVTVQFSIAKRCIIDKECRYESVLPYQTAFTSFVNDATLPVYLSRLEKYKDYCCGIVDGKENITCLTGRGVLRILFMCIQATNFSLLMNIEECINKLVYQYQA